MTEEKRGYFDLVRPWILLEEFPLQETPIFSLRERTASSLTRPEVVGRFVYLDSPDWVNVIALTPQRYVVLIEQFRHGLAEITLEIPGGMVDQGEDALAAGVRELREETGYMGTGPRLVGSVSPNPAIFNNRCSTILIEDVELTSTQRLDANEEIGVRLVPLAEIAALISRGLIHHALVVAAFQHLAVLDGGSG